MPQARIELWSVEQEVSLFVWAFSNEKSELEFEDVVSCMIWSVVKDEGGIFEFYRCMVDKAERW